MRYGLAVLVVSVVSSIAVASSQKNISTDSANSVVVLILFLTLIGILVGIEVILAGLATNLK